MRPRPFLLLIAGFALALMAAGEADAKEPEWSYDIGDSVSSVAISADGNYITANSYYDNKVYLFDKDGSTPLWNYTTESSVYSVAISADGEYIVAGSNKVYLFHKDSSTPLWSYTTGDRVNSVAISADGDYITASSRDHNIYLFHKDNSTPLWNFTFTDSATGTLSVSIVGQAGGFDPESPAVQRGTTVTWTNDDTLTHTVTDKDGQFDSFDIAPGESWSMTFSELGVFNYYCKYHSGMEGSITVVGSGLYSMAISADGEYIAAGDWTDSKVYLFDKDSNTPLWSYTTADNVKSVAISADGEYIAAGSNKVYLFHKDNSTPLWNYTTGHWVDSVAISADGEYIAAGSLDYKVYLFDKDSSTPLWSYQTENYVYSVAISADGEYIAAGTSENGVYFFHKGSSTPLWNYDTGNYVESVAISADGGYIAVSSWDDTSVYLFNKNVLPTANIDSIEPATIRFDEEVTFSGSGTDRDGTVVAYEWTSDIDGFLSDEEDFSKIGFTGSYAASHSISFRVQDNDGDWSSWSTAELYVYPNARPVATIDSITPSPAEKGWTISFSSTGSDSDGTVVTYSWESSIDGELSTNEDFSSNSLSPGLHTITFRVQDNDGEWSDEKYGQLEIYTIPVALAGDDITVNSGDDDVKFRGQGTDVDGTIALYEWDFDGNGIYDWSSSENGRTTYVYNNKGTFTAVLRVTDNDGFTSTDHLVVTIGRSGGGGDDDDGFLPAPSLAAAVAAVAVIALFRPRKP